MKMKSIFCMLFALLSAGELWAQVPDAFQYQAVVRDDAGVLFCEKPVTVRFTIHRDGPLGETVFSETHQATTSAVGTVSLQVGRGTAVHATLGAIVWSADSHFLEVEVDRGSGYMAAGTQQLLSVPYAKHAASASAVRIQSPNGKLWDLVINDSGTISTREVTPRP
jgi:hypothetical protein